MKKISKLLLILLLMHPVRTYAESAESLTAKGNELYAAGKYEDALKAYDAAAGEQPESGEILFNRGDAYFRMGNYEKAKEAFEAAALQTKDLSLEARSRFNLGNTAFSEAEALSGKNAKEALDRYGLSIRHYRDALRMDPGMEAAAKNIEIARLKMKEVMDRIKQQEEKAGDGRKRQEELKKQLEEAIREQESEIKDNDTLKDKMGRSPDKPFEAEKERLAKDQQRTREKTGEISRRLKDSKGQAEAPKPDPKASNEGKSPDGTKASGEETAEHLEKALDAQKSAVEGIEKSELEGAKSHQQEALSELKKTLSQLEDPDGQSQEQPGPKSGEEEKKGPDGGKENKPQDPSQAGEEKQAGSSPPPADKEQAPEDRGRTAEPSGKEGERKSAQMAPQQDPKDILREEKENRLQLQRSQNMGYQRVEKDW